MSEKVSLQRVYDKIIFDMDGTLVNSHAVVERVWREWALKHGVSTDKVLAASHGRRTHEVIQLFGPAGIDIDREARKLEGEEIADTEGICAVPGAVQLLRWIPDADWAVVTSATRELASRRLLAAGLPLPRVLITAEDVSIGKPHPLGYLSAIDRLRARADGCLVFEDAHAGILAAKAAGCDVVALAGTHPYDFEAGCPTIENYHCISFFLNSTTGPRRWQG